MHFFEYSTVAGPAVRAVRRAVRAVRWAVRAVRQAVRAARRAVMRCVNIYSSKINVKKVVLWKSTFLSTFLSRRTFLGFHSIFGALLELTFLSGYTFLSSLF